jgi:hypothetical protein
MVIGRRTLFPPIGLREIEEAIGTASVFHDLRLAPPGHRDNGIHIFQSVGVYLISQHDSGVLRGLVAVYQLNATTMPLSASYNGRVSIGGISLCKSSDESSLRGASVRQYLTGQYALEMGRFEATISFGKREPRPAGRSRTRVLEMVAVSWRSG